MRWFRDREKDREEYGEDPGIEAKAEEERPVIFIAEETRSISRRMNTEASAPVEPKKPAVIGVSEESLYVDEDGQVVEENRAERSQRRHRKWILPALSIALALALAGAVTWAILERKEKMDYITRINAVYDSAFAQVTSSVNELDNKLSKLIISTGTSAGQTTLLLTDVWKEAGTAQQMLSQLPITHTAVRDLSRFVNQVGDYSYMLERKTALGTPLDANDVAQLTALSHQCNDLSGQLNALYQSGNVHWPQNIDIYLAAVPGNPLDEKLTAGTQDLPQLIYDGPFSDSKANQGPKELPGADVTADQARSMALQALRVANVNLIASGDLDGKVPCYVFEGALPDGGNTLVEVTKKGGLVYNMTVSTPDTMDRMPAPEEMDAIAVKAIDYLNTIGYKDMKSVYTQYSMGFVVVNCVFFTNDVLYYPDMIKVRVNVKNGQPSGLDAQAYILNHVSNRSEPPPVITQTKVVDDMALRMEVDSVRLAVIPTPDLKERFCYEVHGFKDDEEFLVYIDALTGAEQQIFRILDTAEGKMSI